MCTITTVYRRFKSQLKAKFEIPMRHNRWLCVTMCVRTMRELQQSSEIASNLKTFHCSEI